MDIAKYERGYQSIVPIGAVTRIQYFPQRRQQKQQEEKKDHTFQTMFQMQLRETPREENQNFQAYC